MPLSLRQQFDDCRDALLDAVIDSLNESTDYITSIERTANGDLPLTALAIELFPWHESFALSLRSTADYPLGESQYDSADWQHFQFTEECSAASIQTAISCVAAIYQRGKQTDSSLTDMAHLTFLAAADALLDTRVALVLNELGIDAPIISNKFVSSAFQYIVVDADQALKSNYCDVVLSNRIRERLLGSAA